MKIHDMITKSVSIFITCMINFLFIIKNSVVLILFSGFLPIY